MQEHGVKVIATIHTDFATKFGVPRQSGLVKGLTGRIVFEPGYRRPEAFRGLEGFSHIWLLWCFSEARREEWSPTVRPPRLGGNVRMGVFATRSPFRPNAIGLSSVRLLRVEWHPEDGPVLWVEGADLADGTPIYDIKPYLPYTDAHPDATGGFTDALQQENARLQVLLPDGVCEALPGEKREALIEVLAADPRPHYQQDGGRVYGMGFAGHEVRFKVEDGVLEVISIK